MTSNPGNKMMMTTEVFDEFYISLSLKNASILIKRQIINQCRNVQITVDDSAEMILDLVYVIKQKTTNTIRNAI